MIQIVLVVVEISVPSSLTAHPLTIQSIYSNLTDIDDVVVFDYDDYADDHEVGSQRRKQGMKSRMWVGY